MTRTRRGVALGLALVGLLGLSACGSRHVMARYASAPPSSVALSAGVLPGVRLPAALPQAPAVVPVVPVSASPSFAVRPVDVGPALRLAAASPRAAAAARAAPPAIVARPRFGDADPVAWTGGTPAAYPVHGIDVSRWQTGIDWPTARANGVSFAFIKATDGGDYLDPLFARHWRAAGAAGVPRGAYHFYYFCRSAEEQARWFIANVPREPGALPPVLDVEWNSESSCRIRPDPATVRAEMAVFLNLVGAHYGQQPIVYTTVDFWKDNELWRVSGIQPWLRAVTRHPSEAYPGADWAFWQYSGTGLVPGIAGEVDLNAFAGTPEAWAVWLAANRL